MSVSTKIYVVIPTFNRKGHLLRCLRCLAEQEIAVEVIISDSGSTDGTATVADQFANVTRLSGHSELWWTGAINLALSHIGRIARDGNYFLLLNDDTEFDRAFISNLLKTARAGERRIVGAVCTDRTAPDRVVDGGTLVNWWTAKSQALNVGRSLGDFVAGHNEPVSVLSGRGAFYPVSVLTEVGMPEAELLPHYAADYEYAKRCATRGYELVVAYDAVVLGDLTTTGLHQPDTRWSIPSASRFFFGRRSACNLIDRFHYARLTASGFLSCTAFYLCTVARLCGRYVRSTRQVP